MCIFSHNSRPSLNYRFVFLVLLVYDIELYFKSQYLDPLFKLPICQQKNSLYTNLCAELHRMVIHIFHRWFKYCTQPTVRWFPFKPPSIFGVVHLCYKIINYSIILLLSSLLLSAWVVLNGFVLVCWQTAYHSAQSVQTTRAARPVPWDITGARPRCFANVRIQLDHIIILYHIIILDHCLLDYTKQVLVNNVLVYNIFS